MMCGYGDVGVDVDVVVFVDSGSDSRNCNSSNSRSCNVSDSRSCHGAIASCNGSRGGTVPVVADGDGDSDGDFWWGGVEGAVKWEGERFVSDPKHMAYQ
eukprot:1393226-Amorphochlora_amoeboformis.AAC.2